MGYCGWVISGQLLLLIHQTSPVKAKPHSCKLGERYNYGAGEENERKLARATQELMSMKVIMNVKATEAKLLTVAG